MIGRWTRQLVWRPFELMCRHWPLVPLKATLTQPVDGVHCIRIENVVTNAIGKLGGYAYSTCYLIDNTILLDTGYAWARRVLGKTLRALQVEEKLRWVVNSHYHEDHTGNNDLLTEMTDAKIVAHSESIPEIRFPKEKRWYRRFLFGPTLTSDVSPIAKTISTPNSHFEVHHMPGHCRGHIVLFEPHKRWLFSGDLYIAAELDSQLSDANGPEWIVSLQTALQWEAEYLFDAHGTIISGANAVRDRLQEKLAFLEELARRIESVAQQQSRTVDEITKLVFTEKRLVDYLSHSDGWLSLLTGADFSRTNLVRTFLHRR